MLVVFFVVWQRVVLQCVRCCSFDRTECGGELGGFGFSHQSSLAYDEHLGEDLTYYLGKYLYGMWEEGSCLLVFTIKTR